jgi:ankyrin repeat protein
MMTNEKDETSIFSLFKGSRKATYDEILAFLEDHPSSIDCLDANGRTPLFTVIMLGDLNIIHLFLDREADSNAQDNYGHTPLYITQYSSGNAILISDLLLEYNADPALRNHYRVRSDDWMHKIYDLGFRKK